MDEGVGEETTEEEQQDEEEEKEKEEQGEVTQNKEQILPERRSRRLKSEVMEVLPPIGSSRRTEKPSTEANCVFFFSVEGKQGAKKPPNLWDKSQDGWFGDLISR